MCVRMLVSTIERYAVPSLCRPLTSAWIGSALAGAHWWRGALHPHQCDQQLPDVHHCTTGGICPRGLLAVHLLPTCQLRQLEHTTWWVTLLWQASLVPPPGFHHSRQLPAALLAL
jgi:hypothetical protein